MSDFQPPTPTYRAQIAGVWNWWKSTARKPQLWGVYLAWSAYLIIVPNPSALFLGEIARPVGTVGAICSTLMVLRNWSLGRRARAQVTIPDVVYFGAGFLIIALLAQPIYQLINQQAGELGAGAGYLLQMVIPGFLMTMLIILFAIAVGGRS